MKRKATTKTMPKDLSRFGIKYKGEIVKSCSLIAPITEDGGNYTQGKTKGIINGKEVRNSDAQKILNMIYDRL